MTIRSTTTMRGRWGGEGKKEKRNTKESTEQVKIRIINVFLESLFSESFPVLTLLGCPPTLC